MDELAPNLLNYYMHKEIKLFSCAVATLHRLVHRSQLVMCRMNNLHWFNVDRVSRVEESIVHIHWINQIKLSTMYECFQFIFIDVNLRFYTLTVL